LFPVSRPAKRRFEVRLRRYIAIQGHPLKEKLMYIGLGTIVVILLVLLLIGVLR
jgi:hypothetical protein